MIDELEIKMRDVFTDLTANNVSAIAKELSENPEGKLQVALGLKMKLVGCRIYLTGTLAYSRKFTDELESMVEFNDPQQPKLDIEVTTNFKRSTDKVVAAMDKVFSDKGLKPQRNVKIK